MGSRAHEAYNSALMPRRPVTAVGLGPLVLVLGCKRDGGARAEPTKAEAPTSPKAAPPSEPAFDPMKMAGPGPRPKTIDVHGHVVPTAWKDALAMMDRYGTDHIIN